MYMCVCVCACICVCVCACLCVRVTVGVRVGVVVVVVVVVVSAVVCVLLQDRPNERNHTAPKAPSQSAIHTFSDPLGGGRCIWSLQTA